ncbi:uvrABC system protein A [Firmicutes bacterium CAG:449]|nr:uvrABC system protein A [Firmicutes bacterium CAG:449]
MSIDQIIVKGARENNLKNIDITLPKNKLIVFTGVSGSGKSTLAFDTIYNEGERRYMESLSSYARQFLGGNEKPDVDSIDGLSPAISIDQKTTSHNPRSTVGTVTEIYDYLRLLFARIGVPYCPIHHERITKFTPKQIVDIIMQRTLGSKIYIMAPLVKNEKGTHKDTLLKFHGKGFERFRVDGEIKRFSEIGELEKNKKHFIEIVVDRLILKEDSFSRVFDSVEVALDVSNGYVIVKDENNEQLFSEHASCLKCGFSVPELEPRFFSFNNPLGACPDCGGLGIKREVAEDLLIPNDELSINQGAVAYFKNQVNGNNIEWQEFKYLCDYYAIPRDIPYKDLTRKQKDILLFGTNDAVSYKIVSSSGNVMNRRGFEGIKTKIDRLYRETDSSFKRDWFETYMRDKECTTCHGARLNEQVLSVRINDLNIYDVCKLSLAELKKFLENLKLTIEEEKIARLVLQEIKNRVNFLINVGLDYLSLSRMAMTLSGGEAQRIRLATQIGSRLTGVLYVLDEPSIGLHQRDNDKLIASLKQMRDLGNTLIVVEHDEDTMLASDYLVDIGPGAGIHGGNIVAAGTPEEVMNNPASLTGLYLSGKKFIPYSTFRNKGNGNFIEIIGAEANNLKKVNVKIPLGCLVLVTGVSGSGKSSLVTEVLYKNTYNYLNRAKMEAGKVKQIKGLENIDKVINISQDPIGKTPRSNPATYIGVFDDIRDLFASTKDARAKGYTKSHFSFNVKGGRCEACEGDGVKRISMSFFPDVYVQCEECHGRRYNDETLAITYKGKNIYDVLEMTCEDATTFFENIPSIYRKVKTLCDVGLGYIKLGQSSTTLSGGEAQRVKLAYELSKRPTGKTLYILDEPTTGLHIDDIRCLLEVLKALVAGGNSVLVIEHNLDVIKCADYIIDLGPEGGEGGGSIVVKGTPEEVSEYPTSYTGQYLKKILSRDKKRMQIIEE